MSGIFWRDDQGRHTSEIFIENGRFHGKLIIDSLASRSAGGTVIADSWRTQICQMGGRLLKFDIRVSGK